MLVTPLIFGMLVAGVVICIGFFFGLRGSRVRERLETQAASEFSPSRPKEEKTLDLEFLPKNVVDKVEDKLGLKKGSAKINELKKSLIQAGIYHDKAPSIYFGLKLGLTVALPVLAMPFLWCFFSGWWPWATSFPPSSSVTWWKPANTRSRRGCPTRSTFWWCAWRPGRV
jgi:hypothetical protein